MGSFRKTLPVLFGVAFLGALGIGGYVALTCIVCMAVPVSSMPTPFCERWSATMGHKILR